LAKNETPVCDWVNMEKEMSPFYFIRAISLHIAAYYKWCAVDTLALHRRLRKMRLTLWTDWNGRACTLRHTDCPPDLFKSRRSHLCPLPREEQVAEDESACFVFDIT
jgi:hypothetical protein